MDQQYMADESIGGAARHRCSHPDLREELAHRRLEQQIVAQQPGY